jgi:fructose-bisphosphate aldolase class 1
MTINAPFNICQQPFMQIKDKICQHKLKTIILCLSGIQKHMKKSKIVGKRYRKWRISFYSEINVARVCEKYDYLIRSRSMYL